MKSVLKSGLRLIVPLLVLAICVPAPALALSPEEARHLLVRSGFSANPAKIEALRPMSREAAVERLLRQTSPLAATPAPAWTQDWTPPRMNELSETERQVLRKQTREKAQELKAWWLEEMITTPTPLTEVMTLFWHNHFTSSLRKVKAPVLLYRQNALLRKEAMGNFGRLLHAIARDPAMLVYLDGARSRKGAPNENFARELFELFTLGEGHYQEADLKETARAFTGWSLNREDGSFTFRRRWHDAGEKAILGKQGEFDGDDVIEILLDHPRTAVFVVDKLWRQFISETPDEAEVARLAKLFRSVNYEIKPLLAVSYPLRDLAKAQEAFIAKRHVGNIVVTLE